MRLAILTVYLKLSIVNLSIRYIIVYSIRWLMSYTLISLYVCNVLYVLYLGGELMTLYVLYAVYV